MEARVNPTVAMQVADILARPTPAELACQGALVVAARMLIDTSEYAMTATTVVGLLGNTDAEDFESLVQDIAQEFGVDASVTLKKGSFCVLCTRTAPCQGPRRSG